MSLETINVGPVQQHGEPDSLADRIAQRRKQRDADRSRIVTVPVAGYENLIAGAYRRLSAAERRDIESQHPNMEKDFDAAVAAACDGLIRANVDLLEVTGRNADGSPEYRSIGRTWQTGVIVDLFRINLPEGTLVRQALQEALDPEEVLDHFAAYSDAVGYLERADAEALPGESVPTGVG